MLQVTKIREQIDFVKERLAVKNFKPMEVIDEIVQDIEGNK